MIVQFTAGPGPDDAPNPQYGAGLSQLSAALGCTGRRANLPIGSASPDMVRVANYKGWTGWIVFDYTPAGARPSQEQVETDVQNGAAFLNALRAAGSKATFIVKGINEPKSLNTAQPWNPDPELIQVHEWFYAAVAQYMPGVATGSPTFYGGNDVASAMMSAWMLAESWNWTYTFINCAPAFPNMGLSLEQFVTLTAWCIEQQVSQADSCFPGTKPFILEYQPVWQSFMSSYEPETFGQYLGAAFKGINPGGHLNNGGAGIYAVFERTSSEPTGNPETDGCVALAGPLNDMGNAAVAAWTTSEAS